MADDRVQLQGSGFPGLVDDEQRGGIDGGEPRRDRRSRWVVDEVEVLVKGVGGCAQVCAEIDRGRRGRSQAEHGAAGVAPGVRQRGHGGGLSCAGRGEGKRDTAAVGGHFGNEGNLARVEVLAAGSGVRERDLDVGVCDCPASVEGGGVQDAPLGREDPGAGEQGGSVACVDAGTVAAAKRGGFRHVAVVDARQRQTDRLGERRGGDALRECVIGGMPGGSTMRCASAST